MKMNFKYPICNKKSERAPQFFGHTFILCWRCSMVIVGIICGKFITIAEAIELSLYIMPLGILMMIPMIVDGFFQYILKHESTNFRRALTGFLFGVGASCVIGSTFVF